MVNGLGVMGWGVGGIEAEAAMLGQPISMLIPQVLGVRLTGAMLEGATATDLVLTITERLRKHGVVGKFVEFFGPGLEDLTIADRATLGNMCPEYGATIAIFPIDVMTLDYLRLSGREESQVALVEAYAKAQGMFSQAGDPEPIYTETIDLDLGCVEPSLAGPRRPQDRVSLKQAKSSFQAALPSMMVSSSKKGAEAAGSSHVSATTGGASAAVAEVPAITTILDHGAVVIAAITSCTNTSNPSVMIGAGLVAKKAVARGLKRQPWVKTSLAPGSKVVTEYLRKSGLDVYLDTLGFNLVGYGCTTCIGNSGPLPDDVSAEVEARNLVVASVLSGNRNFEGRIQQQVRANYLASPPLVVAYALAGKMTIDLTTEPIGIDSAGVPVYLRELWPTEREIQETMLTSVTSTMFREQYADVFSGDDRWKLLQVPTVVLVRFVARVASAAAGWPLPHVGWPSLVGAVTEDKRLKFMPIDIAGTDGKVIRIANGISEGVRVALNVPNTISDGAKHEAKPAGAAKASFMKKCMAEDCAAKAVSAEGKPLSGAAKTSFMKKCEKGA